MNRKAEKVGAQYRLPKTLVRWVKEEALKQETMACLIVERILTEARDSTRRRKPAEAHIEAQR